MEHEMSIKTYREAIHDALEEEMDRDADVILMGEDIGVYGGGFGATAGLLKKYGKSRVLDTPISETAFVGTAIGAAVTGMRPVVELMFSDFMSVCWDQIMNEAAKMHFMYAGSLKVPLVIRTAAGGGTGAAEGVAAGGSGSLSRAAFGAAAVIRRTVLPIWMMESSERDTMP